MWGPLVVVRTEVWRGLAAAFGQGLPVLWEEFPREWGQATFEPSSRWWGREEECLCLSEEA